MFLRWGRDGYEGGAMSGNRSGFSLRNNMNRVHVTEGASWKEESARVVGCGFCSLMLQNPHPTNTRKATAGASAQDAGPQRLPR